MRRKLLLVLPLLAMNALPFNAKADDLLPLPHSTDVQPAASGLKASQPDVVDVIYEDPRKLAQNPASVSDSIGQTTHAYDMHPGKLVSDTAQYDKAQAEKKPGIDNMRVGTIERTKVRRFTFPMKWPTGAFN